MAYKTTSSIDPATSLLHSNQTSPPPHHEAESLPVLREEVEEAVHSVKGGESPEVDNIPSELFKNAGEAATTRRLTESGMQACGKSSEVST